ncbi:uncharacterized protein CC84DRAFT_1209372 [Paraphaeosphaeria sporulosa]|uniref:Uncharacterized protein n=1 Tax=Paraphaeosphaeria sporulosa TaxID=1460663 RepID=A0A177BY07_9PLEO|nr:uncharacterized protein CC84DRAFT_1209372 [Paraphaeosphaeria sporulosa]OAG00404.1 hypothetical protein CC84DRAFT_1209372 [Paraphaeosphaeria sporulosa]
MPSPFIFSAFSTVFFASPFATPTSCSFFRPSSEIVPTCGAAGVEEKSALRPAAKLKVVFAILPSFAYLGACLEPAMPVASAVPGISRGGFAGVALGNGVGVIMGAPHQMSGLAELVSVGVVRGLVRGCGFMADVHVPGMGWVNELRLGLEERERLDLSHLLGALPERWAVEVGFALPAAIEVGALDLLGDLGKSLVERLT